jgi:hypothetical protein
MRGDVPTVRRVLSGHGGIRPVQALPRSVERRRDAMKIIDPNARIPVPIPMESTMAIPTVAVPMRTSNRSHTPNATIARSDI